MSVWCRTHPKKNAPVCDRWSPTHAWCDPAFCHGPTSTWTAPV